MVNFRDALSESADLPLFITGDGLVTRNQALAKADHYARCMYADGMREGDTILLDVRETLSHNFVRLACVFLGITPLLAPGISRIRPRDYEALDALVERYQPKYSVTEIEVLGWDSRANDAALLLSNYPAPTTDFTVLHKPSSGTTGTPKDFLITRSLIEGLAKYDALNFGLSPGDCFMFLITSMDTVHTVAFSDALLSALLNKWTYALLGPRRRSEEFAAFLDHANRVIEGSICIVFQWGPTKTGPWPSTFMTEFFADSTPALLAKVVRITSHYEIDTAIVAELESKMTNGVYINSYGFRETPIRVCSRPTDPAIKRYTTLGRTPDHGCVKLLETGELVVKSVMVAHTIDDDRRDSFDAEGWYHSKDVFEPDVDAYFVYKRRLGAN